MKPANVIVTPQGVVKVLDFGLAAFAQGSSSTAGDPSVSPTLTIRATEAGMILGTAPYMSPEQAGGKPVDKRSDIWSFGVVLWEMLTGERLFQGETISHTLADVLRGPIEFGKLPAHTPAAIRELLLRCLDRDVKTRLQAIGEARISLQKYLANPASSEVSINAPTRPRLTVALSIAAGMLLAALGAMVFVHYRQRAPALELVRFQLAPPGKPPFAQGLALSPDGRYVAFTALGEDGIARLWIHSLDSLGWHPLAGTEGFNPTSYPFWSWDSLFVVFQAAAYGGGGKLKKVEVSGGPPQTLCDLPGVLLRGFWSRDGRIVIGTSATGLLQVPSGGGAVSALTTMNAGRGETNHGFPALLPDGRHFVYRVFGRAESAGIYLRSLDEKPGAQLEKRLLSDQSLPLFVPSLESGAAPDTGYLLLVREGTLIAQPFDARSGKLSGDATPVAQDLNIGSFGVSDNGVLIFRASVIENRQLTWFDRHGNALNAASKPAMDNFVALSPDGTRAAVQRFGPGRLRGGDIWIIDFARGGFATRFTFDPADDAAPVWSPDGTRILWASNRDGYNLYQKPALGGNEELVLKSGLRLLPYDWSSDGRFLLFGSTDPKTNSDLWALPMRGEPKPLAVVQTEFTETQGRFSPDMRWVAYQSDESGRFEIYVRPFPPSSAAGGSVTVSNGGGYQPRWRRKDGKELFYFTGDGKLMAVDVSTGPALKIGEPHILFSAPIYGGGQGTEVTRWDLTADGQKFLMVTESEQSTPTPITVVLNWQAGLKPPR